MWKLRPLVKGWLCYAFFLVEFGKWHLSIASTLISRNCELEVMHKPHELGITGVFLSVVNMWFPKFPLLDFSMPSLSSSFTYNGGIESQKVVKKEMTLRPFISGKMPPQPFLSHKWACQDSPWTSPSNFHINQHGDPRDQSQRAEFSREIIKRELRCPDLLEDFLNCNYTGCNFGDGHMPAVYHSIWHQDWRPIQLLFGFQVTTQWIVLASSI